MDNVTDESKTNRDLPDADQGLMIANQSVQQIPNADRVQEDDSPTKQGSQEDIHNLQDQAETYQLLYPDQKEPQHNYGLPVDILPQEQEELNAIIETISYGNTQQVKKLKFQAFTAAIAHEK